MTVDDDLIGDAVDARWDETEDRWQQPSDLVDADWHARRLVRFAAKIAEFRDVAARETAAIDAWLERQCGPAERAIARHEDALRRFHDARLARDPKSKTIDLPSEVVLRSRTGRVSVVVDDEIRLAGWLEDHDTGLMSWETKAKIDKAGVVARYGGKAIGREAGDFPAFDPDTGEILPGVMLRRGDMSWTVELPRVENDGVA